MNMAKIQALVERSKAGFYQIPRNIGPLDLLILQPTPFCNLDCKYCYLPERSSTKKMKFSVLECILNRVFESNLVENHFSIVWHAGEPLVPGIDYYQKAFEIIEQIKPSGIDIHHSIQTNGVLIDDDWCRFFRDHSINIGVSVDGPAFIHDRYRHTRTGLGTHHLVQQGIDNLHSNNIPFHTISVLTDYSINHPEAMFNYFLENGITQCGFNIEEIEGVNQHSSLSVYDIKDRVSIFFREFLRLNEEHGFPLCVRELDGAKSVILNWRKEAPDWLSTRQELVPYKIITVDCDGNFSTFSPELVGAKTLSGNSFILGNVFDISLLDATKTKWFKEIYGSIAAGVKKCKSGCQYYSFCGGGAPSNKYFEQDTFNCDETLFCQLHIQIPLAVTLDYMESQIMEEQVRSE